jgi:hypothetical protein
VTRYGFRPSKIAFLAHHAWGDIARGHWPNDVPKGLQKAYSLPEIRHWLTLFLTRFFANQFKRSALPNGPKISSGGSLSPRGDWRAPSDADAAVWIADLDHATAIREKLLTELNKQNWAHTAPLNATVNGGVVDLWGFVESDTERKAIRVAAEAAPGVRAVNDHMTARPIGY